MFLSPFALFALAALALPAILHLWRPPPATVRVGTLKFFSDPAVRRLTKLRWRERLLLAIRLLLLALLAFLLAQPIWKKTPPTTPQRWALIEPGVVLHGEALNRSRELDGNGFEMRELSNGFRIIGSRAKPGAQPSEPTDVWSLLRELDARLPAGSTVAVFAKSRIVSLRGERPAMKSAAVEWIAIVPDEASQRTWIRSAQRAKKDQTAGELRVVVASSDAARTENITATTKAVAGKTQLPKPLDGWSLEIAELNGNNLSARLLREDNSIAPGPWIPVADHKPLNVVLLHSADRAEDARFVNAAISAAAEMLGRETAFGSDAARADWLVWLNDEPPPPEVIAEVTNRGGTILSDAENTREAAASMLTAIEADALHEPVALFRRVMPAAENDAAFWTDGFGTPLLTMTRQGSGRWLRFFSRFHPDWNDLPRSSALAVALQPLLFEGEREAGRDANEDQRRAEPSQARPAEAVGSAAGFRLEAAADMIDVHSVLWLLCVALFALERALSHFSGNGGAYSARRAPVAHEQPAFAEQV